ncbi:MAG: substrate-binding domain-containing protein [Planctomycetia bacterium]
MTKHHSRDRPATPVPGAEHRPLLVAVVVDPAVWFDREIVAGAAQFAREAGDWQLYVEEESPNRLPDLRSWRGHGIIASFSDRRVARAIVATGLPAVAVGGSSYAEAIEGIPCVCCDNAAIAMLAAEHLLDRGLRTFGYYGTVVSDTTGWSQARGPAFAARVGMAGHPCDVLTASRSSRHWSHVQAELCRWLKALPKPVGIMACDDLRARHVLEACRTLGCRVPHDVAVIGVDNDELICDLAAPPLSSVAQATRRIGYEAARLVDQMIRKADGTDSAARRPGGGGLLAIPPVGVVARGSTDTLAVADPVIAKVIRLIRDQDLHDLQVADIVAASGLPRWKLESRFKRCVGHSIHDDIVRTRLAAAMVLVRTTALPLKLVAPRAGFHSVPYMVTMFKRHFGVTPAKLRKHEQATVVRPT